VAAGFELGPDVGVVVDLAVEDDPDGAVFVRQRLLAGLEIDDAETAVAEGGSAVDMEARFVGAAMRDDVAHGHDALAGVGPELRGGDESGDTAHNLSGLHPHAASRERSGRDAPSTYSLNQSSSIIRLHSRWL
jgi:hypothetical protein